MSEKGDTDCLNTGPEYSGHAYPISKQPSKLHSGLSLFTKVLVSILAIHGLYSLSRSSFPTPMYRTTGTVVCNCGNSTSEAKSRGCKFDSLATAWLPSACRDDELTAEFEGSGPLENGSWPYYKDLRKEHLISVEDLASMADDENGRTYYVTSEWFLARCLFYWRKMERAESRGTTIEKSFLDTSIDGHDISNWHHCSDVYLKRVPREQIAAAGVVGFGDPVH